MFSKTYSIILVIVLFTNCGFNRIQELDEKTNSSFAELLSQYKRRADLLPGLLEIVKGAANFEKEVLVEVATARSNLGSVKASPELVKDEEAFKKFLSAQNQLTGSLHKLMGYTEKYPELKANQNFRDLQAQYEGTENRIEVARVRYIKSVEEYNIYIRQFPGILWANAFGYKTKTSFSVDNEDSIKKLDPSINEAPKMKFDSK
ncbi:MAG: LemA family protein [Leptospiraceae bacterium]|nr:LemA family protein [Leptospiraceae bacterium]